MAKGKEKIDKSATEQVELPPTFEQNVPEILPDVKHIRISVIGYKNIASLFLVSELEVKATYLEVELGVTSRTQVVDDNNIPINRINNEFVFECDINSQKDLDKLISNPVLLSVTEIPGTINDELVEQLEAQKKPPLTIINLSAESEADLSAAYGGKPVDKTALVPSKSKDKSEKGSKQKTPSKTSKEGASKEKLPEEEIKIPTDPTLMGTSILDLLPLFLGQREIREDLPIRQAEKFYDDRIVPNKIMPRLSVFVTIDEEDWLPEDNGANILSITIESVYNIPSLMSEEMQYNISMFLPTTFGKWDTLVLKGGKLKNTRDEDKMKKWPALMDAFGITTQYRLDESIESIRNPIDSNLDVTQNPIHPRIQWNIIKRSYLNVDGNRELLKRLSKFRRLPLELYVTSKKEESLTEALDDGKGKDKKGKPEKGKKGSKEISCENYLHLMTVLDVSTLLYPGVKKCRVLCPLSTYQENEILLSSGLSDSYFMPKKIMLPTWADLDIGKSSKGGQVSSKGSKGASLMGGKGGGDMSDDNKKDLKPLLPLPLPEPEPSTPVYCETGERTFIIIEVEVSEPLQPKRPIEDLSEELSQLLPPQPPMSKIAVSSQLTNLYFENVIKELTDDLTHQHQAFLIEKEECKKCDSYEETPQSAFISYLQRTGVYQTYLATITKSTSVMVNDKYPYSGKVDRSSKIYQNYVAEVYCSLIKEMNVVLNKLMSLGVEDSPSSPLMGLDSMLLYAREACEIGATLLADRYYLERICVDDKNENYWFDYAVFKLHLGEHDQAFECVKQSLSINCKQRYSLLLFGIFLAEKKSFEEAETCFLTLMLQNQNWLEGWGAMHLFYNDSGNMEGADLCLEMATKYVNSPNAESSYFNSVDDLAWTSEVCPQNIFLKTAVMFLKMRAFNYAQRALALALMKNPGITNYYLAVIEYYRKNYEQALAYLQVAEELHGSDYAVASLTGHCYLQLGKLEESQEQYMRVLESYNRPNDVHMIFVYLALIWEKQNDKQSARKLLLLACKFSPTPYTWLSCGLLYYSQRDLLSAEECLTQANLCDNRLPEIWGYLTLVNLELNRESEAELCFRQTKKHDMKNQDLSKRIDDLLKSKKMNLK